MFCGVFEPCFLGIRQVGRQRRPDVVVVFVEPLYLVVAQHFRFYRSGVDGAARDGLELQELTELAFAGRLANRQVFDAYAVFAFAVNAWFY